MPSQSTIWLPEVGYIPIYDAERSIVSIRQLASVSQTLFTLEGINYRPNTNSILIYRNKEIQTKDLNYTEEDPTSIRFKIPASENEEFIFIVFTRVDLVYQMSYDEAVKLIVETDFQTRRYAEKLVAGVSPGSGTGAFLQRGTGAEIRTFQDKIRDFAATPYDFSALPGDLDNTAAIQKALNSGQKVVRADDRLYHCESIEVPAGVTFYCNLQKITPLGPFVRVNSNAIIIGKLRGTGPIGEIEQLIYPAADSVNDVKLDVDVTNSSYGVHARHITDIAKAPRRWTGIIRATDMSGDGTQRGYGLLCSPAYEFDFVVYGLRIPRHSLYLSNGASGNKITVHSDTAGYGDVQIASADGQPHCLSNEITIFARNMQHPVGDNSFACNMIGNVRLNKIRAYVSASPNADGAVLLRSASAISICRDNDIEVFQDGPVSGQAIVQCDAAPENTISVTGVGGTTFGEAGAVIGVYNYNSITVDPTSYIFAIRVKKLDYNAGGLLMRGVTASFQGGIVDIGKRVINFQNAAPTSRTIVDNTGTPSRIEGWVTENYFDVTVALPASGTVIANIPFSIPMPTKRDIFYTPIIATAGITKYPSHVVSSLGASSASIFIVNNGNTATNIGVRGVAHGY